MSTPELTDFLVEAGLARRGDAIVWTPLAGGVSSDIWRVDTPRGAFCVKRALAKLRVAADWEAPVERNASEWDYMCVAAAIAPQAIPRPIAHDPARGAFAMEWLSPAEHKLWKAELLDGRVDVGAAQRVGDLLGRIHAATARDASLAARFATDASFHALRIDPYILATARAHADLAGPLEAIAARTAATKRALVHGDVSPKNIMLGPAGPVLLDAECAWWGDPAFDLAFCLNHLAIKRRILPNVAASLTASFDALAGAYLAHVDWEPRVKIEARAAGLLPALALARVDGKSPVEYLKAEERDALRTAARAAILAAPSDLKGAQALLAA